MHGADGIDERGSNIPNCRPADDLPHRTNGAYTCHRHPYARRLSNMPSASQCIESTLRSGLRERVVYLHFFECQATNIIVILIIL